MRDAVQRCLDALGGRADRLTLVRAAVDQALWDPGESDLAQRYAVAHVATECHRLVVGSDDNDLPVCRGARRALCTSVATCGGRRTTGRGCGIWRRDECRRRWGATCSLAALGCARCGADGSGDPADAPVEGARGDGD